MLFREKVDVNKLPAIKASTFGILDNGTNINEIKSGKSWLIQEYLL